MARHIDSDDVNGYLREAMGEEFSAKDFRTWAGTVLAVRAMQSIEAGANLVRRSIAPSRRWPSN